MRCSGSSSDVTRLVPTETKVVSPMTLHKCFGHSLKRKEDWTLLVFQHLTILKPLTDADSGRVG